MSRTNAELLCKLKEYTSEFTYKEVTQNCQNYQDPLPAGYLREQYSPNDLTLRQITRGRDGHLKYLIYQFHHPDSDFLIKLESRDCRRCHQNFLSPGVHLCHSCKDLPIKCKDCQNDLPKGAFRVYQIPIYSSVHFNPYNLGFQSNRADQNNGADQNNENGENNGVDGIDRTNSYIESPEQWTIVTQRETINGICLQCNSLQRANYLSNKRRQVQRK